MKTLSLFSLKFLLILTVLCSCSDSDDSGPAPEGATSVELPSDLVDSYSGALQYIVNQLPVTTEADGTATLVETGDKVYKVTFSNDVPEITGLTFIENDGTYASASASNSIEGVSLRSGSLTVGLTVGDERWAFSSN